ncbi:MAG TPA: FecR domain-containing protein [Gemmatimonadales bacterium]|nr:FecR domain-containing protein [Gemmatimonadales bacterium]
MNPRDIDWERLDRYVAGEGTPDELEALRRWVDSDPRLQALAEVMRTAQRLPDASQTWNAAASWHSVAERLGLPKEPAAAPRPAAAPAARARGRGHGDARRVLRLAPAAAARRWRWTHGLGALAAALALVVGIDRAADELARRREAAARAAEVGREYVATRGQRVVFHLPDQTQVTLAPESRLRVSPAYGRGSREVVLEGQAYFVVTHDSTQPFSVRTDRLVARDLGTRFVVRAYPGNPTPDVIVAEGLVALGRAQEGGGATGDTLLLEPGDLGRVMKSGVLVRRRGVSVDRYLAWTAGELRFRGTRLRDAVVELGRWYGVDIRLADGTAGDERVTAAFKDEPAPTAIGLVASAAGLEVERHGAQFILRRPGK